MADADGQFRRKESRFRAFISKDPSSQFPAEKDRKSHFRSKSCPNKACIIDYDVITSNAPGIFFIISKMPRDIYR